MGRLPWGGEGLLLFSLILSWSLIWMMCSDLLASCISGCFWGGPNWRISEEDQIHQEKLQFHRNSACWAFGAANPSALEASSCAWDFLWRGWWQEVASGIGFERMSWDWLSFFLRAWVHGPMPPDSCTDEFSACAG